MSRILADKVTNYNNDGPFEAEKGINIPLARPLQVSGNAGVSGQYLASTGVGLTWETFPELFSGNYADLTNKPTLFSGSYNDLSNKPAILNINLGIPVSNQYLKFNGSQWINADLPPIYEYDISTSYNPSNQRVGIILSDQFSTQSAVSIYGDNGITVATDVNENIVITSPVVSEYDSGTAKDDISDMFLDGTNTGITYTYNPITKTINSSVDLADQLIYTLYGSSPAANSAKIYLDNGTTESGAVTLVGTNGIDISWNIGESKITFSKDDPDPYVLPPATTSSLGGIIPDASDFTIDGNGNLTVNFPASGISLTSLSVAPEAVPSGNGALGYDNTTGQFTYTPPSFSINDLTDVTISAVPEQNALLQWKGTYWDYVSIYNLGLKLDDLSEVGDLSAASDYQVLQRIGNQWVSGNIYLGNQSIHYLDDVGMGKSTNPTMNIEEDSVLAWNNGSSTWEVKKLKLEDFDVSAQATNGQTLVWNGTTNKWVPTTISTSGSGLSSRITSSANTNVIANLDYDLISFTAFKSYSLMKIETDVAARVILYCDDASRTADLSRSEGTNPTLGSGVIIEIITTAAQTVLITPAVLGFNNDATPDSIIYAKVVNKSGVTQEVNVTLTLLQLEA